MTAIGIGAPPYARLVNEEKSVLANAGSSSTCFIIVGTMNACVTRSFGFGLRNQFGKPRHPTLAFSDSYQPGPGKPASDAVNQLSVTIADQEDLRLGRVDHVFEFRIFGPVVQREKG